MVPPLAVQSSSLIVRTPWPLHSFWPPQPCLSVLHEPWPLQALTPPQSTLEVFSAGWRLRGRALLLLLLLDGRLGAGRGLFLLARRGKQAAGGNRDHGTSLHVLHVLLLIPDDG